MPHRDRHPPLSSHLRPQGSDDRRHYHRFPQHGMMVRVGERLLHVHDLSIGGIRVERFDVAPGTALSLQLMPRNGRQLELARAHPVEGVVLAHAGEWTRIRFNRLSYTLAKLIIDQLARSAGVEPYIFR